MSKLESAARFKFLYRCRIPKIYWKVKWDSVPEERHKLVAQTFATDMVAHLKSGRGLLFWGEHSQGKTALACLLLRELLQHKKTGLFVTSEDITSYVIKGNSFDEAETWVERLNSVDLLVIDELITKDGESFNDGRVEWLVRQRIMACKSTIITTNVPLSVLREKSRGLFEAIREALYPIEVKGKDFRKEASTHLQEHFE
jgi:DNA replication protein DnaC